MARGRPKKITPPTPEPPQQPTKAALWLDNPARKQPKRDGVYVKPCQNPSNT